MAQHPNSRAAWNQTYAWRDAVEAEVYAFVLGRGEQGATADEVEVALAGRHQTISARTTELKGRGMADRLRSDALDARWPPRVRARD